MATAAVSSLSSELECSICSSQLEQPKYIGPCNHTFCKDCIDKHWFSLNCMSTIPCPECRQECSVPQNGVDGLKDNFKLANIIKKYQKHRTARDICTQCPNEASSLCKECDLKFCPKCKEQHDGDPMSCDHDSFGLCLDHGNGLFFFCNTCKQAICSRCKQVYHNQLAGCDVKPIRQLVDDLTTRIRATSTELEESMTSHEGVEEERKLLQLLDNMKHKSTSAEEKATADTENALAKKRKDIQYHTEKSQAIQKKIDILVKEKEKEDERTKQLAEDVDKLEKEKAKIIADVREKFAISSEEINLRLRSNETLRKEMTMKLKQGRVVGSSKITIDTKSIGDLTSLNQELIGLVRATRESDTRTVRERIWSSIKIFGHNIVNIRYLLSGETNQVRVFPQLQKVCDVTFPRDQQRKPVCRLKNLREPKFNLVTLGRSQGDEWADTIYFLDKVHSLTGTITEGVYPATDMAVLSTGEVVVTRQEKPPLRVFNPGTGAYRDINITLKGKEIGVLWRVETDESDNMFVSTESKNPLLLLVRPNGDVIQSVQLSGDSYNMAFLSLNRLLYIAAGDRFRRFRYTDTLGEISSSPHGVAGFRCSDVCVGGGEVLVAGMIGNEDVAIYQLTQKEDKVDLVWRKIEYQDGVNRKTHYKPSICICEDNIWLGCNDRIEKFQLA